MPTVAEVFTSKIDEAKEALVEAVEALQEMPDSKAKAGMIKEIKETIGDLHCVSSGMSR